MAGDPLDVIGPTTVHARRPRLWCRPVRLAPVQFNHVHIDGALALFRLDEKAVNDQVRSHQTVISPQSINWCHHFFASHHGMWMSRPAIGSMP